jgi:acyl-CoA thioesterase I
MKPGFLIYFSTIILSSALNITPSCQFSDTCRTNSHQKTINYLALGDSYTIGEGVIPEESWPVLLAKAMTTDVRKINHPVIIAKTGWRTDNLLDALERDSHINTKFGLISISIGVNNQFQGKSITEYEKDLHRIFKKALSLSIKGKSGIFVVSIPDYSATTYGKIHKPAKISKAIDKWNNVLKQITLEYGFLWQDITEISRLGAKNMSLISDDGLHPSPKMYEMWVRQIAEDLDTSTF